MSFATAARAAAPHAGSALKAGASVAVGTAVASRATRWARRRAEDMLDDLSLAWEATRNAADEDVDTTATEQVS